MSGSNSRMVASICARLTRCWPSCFSSWITNPASSDRLSRKAETTCGSPMAALLDEEREAGTIKHRRHAATVAPGGKCYIRADMSGTLKGLHIGLAGATIVSAWFFIHLTYALHYAHEYFDECLAEPGRPVSERGGLKFPGTGDPDYYDFLYFSYVIGVACQTADVE